MKFLFRTLPTLLFALSLLTVPSQAIEPNGGHISGSVRSSSGSPLQDAFIHIFKSAKQEEFLSILRTRSNQKGSYRASNLTPGVYYLNVSLEGYETVSTEKIEVKSNRTTTLNFTLENVIHYISNEDDPRNWDIKTVLRSSSDRRMIFRHMPAGFPETDMGKPSAFLRSGTMSLASNTFLGNQHYLNRPHTSRNGFVTNLAFAEPLNRNSRMIFTGQFDFGRSSFWRVRDTIQYRPDEYQDYKVSFGYGRMNPDYVGYDSFESQILPEERDFRQSWIQTLAFGLEGTTRVPNLMTINYGFDYSRLHYGNDRNFIYPSLEIIMSPSDSWAFTTSFTSKRQSDRNSVMLSTGEVLDLSEPTLITIVGDDVSMSHVRHSEMSFKKTITQETALEVAIYRDLTYGPGIPLIMTTITPLNQTSAVINLNEDQSNQQGMRITLDRRVLPNLSGSFAYAYGEATHISDVDASVSIDAFNADFGQYAIQKYHHSITGRIDAAIPETNTCLLATIRWHPGNPVSPIDWFSDSMEIGTKSLNLEIRQMIPTQNNLLNTRRWEMLLDLRNVFNQGEKVIHASDGLLVLNRNPRSLRFGINLSFQ